jgi:hypothetical protein
MEAQQHYTRLELRSKERGHIRRAQRTEPVDRVDDPAGANHVVALKLGKKREVFSLRLPAWVSTLQPTGSAFPGLSSQVAAEPEADDYSASSSAGCQCTPLAVPRSSPRRSAPRVVPSAQRSRRGAVVGGRDQPRASYLTLCRVSILDALLDLDETDGEGPVVGEGVFVFAVGDRVFPVVGHYLYLYTFFLGFWLMWWIGGRGWWVMGGG